jgi:hypothetical protein
MSELTDKELVQLLSDMAEGDLAEGAEVVDHPAYIAAYRITQLRASPWISVDDRLPEVGAWDGSHCRMPKPRHNNSCQVPEGGLHGVPAILS